MELRSRIIPAPARKLEDPANAIRVGFIRSGDQGRGLVRELFHLGRAEDQVPVRGHPREHRLAALTELPGENITFIYYHRQLRQSPAFRAGALLRYAHEDHIHTHLALLTALEDNAEPCPARLTSAAGRVSRLIESSFAGPPGTPVRLEGRQAIREYSRHIMTSPPRLEAFEVAKLYRRWRARSAGHP